MKVREIKRIVKDLNSSGKPYVFLTDKDLHTCLVVRRQSKIDKFGVKDKSLVVVETQIESWYAAGSQSPLFARFQSEEITKSKFDEIVSPNKHSDAQISILKKYKTVDAQTKSQSFSYFYTKIRQLLNNNLHLRSRDEI